jgi:hypothetical protein
VIANPRKYIHNSRADPHSPFHISTCQPGRVWMLVTNWIATLAISVSYTKLCNLAILVEVLSSKFNATVKLYILASISLYNILWERWMTSNCNKYSFDFWGWTHCNTESTPKVHKSSLGCITTSFFCFEVEWPDFHLVEWLLKSPTEICQGFHMLVSPDVDQMFFF